MKIIRLMLPMMLLIAACSQNASNNWKETDLMSHGLPVKINAPAELQVEKSSFSGSQEFKLSGPDGYGMNVLVVQAASPNPTTVKTELADLVKNGKYFSAFTKDADDGFIYKISIDSTHAVYGFRKVKIQGDKQIVFQNPYMSKLTEEQASSLYASIPD